MRPGQLHLYNLSITKMNKKNERQPLQIIPFEQAQEIAEKYDKDQVVILSWNREHCSTVVTTYGKNIHDSDQAAESGNKIKQGLGWPEHQCHAKSIRVEALLNALEAAYYELIAHNATNSTAYILTKQVLTINKVLD
jgi:hypothetical protein